MESWEDFAAFGDINELELICSRLADFDTGADSHLVKMLQRQYDQSRIILEVEYRKFLNTPKKEKGKGCPIPDDDSLDKYYPGWYERTGVAQLFGVLFVKLDEVTEFPARLPAEIAGICMGLHKVLIHAHEVFDPVHRAELVEKEASRSFTGRQQKNGKFRRPNRKAAKFSGKVLVKAVWTENKKKIWTVAWEWLVQAAQSSNQVGAFSLLGGNTESVEFKAGKKISQIKKGTFEQYWSALKNK